MSSFAPSARVTKPGVAVEGRGVVAAQHHRAAAVGADVLAAGGDAVDAAVAVSFAVGVLEPWMSGPMGGGAMMLWRADEERAEALNFGMRSPAQLDPARYPLAGTGVAGDLFPWERVFADRNMVGAEAVAVPGTVAGAGAAHGRYGRMPWADLLAPAAGLAREGMQVDWYATLMIATSAHDLAADPDAAALFLEAGQWPKAPGWTAVADIRLDQARHAATVDRLAQAGPRDFYEGEIAAALTADLADKGSVLARADLQAYAPEWSRPASFPYGRGRVHAVPGLTAGPTLADAMRRWDGSRNHADRARALREAYAHRLATMGDAEAPGAPGCTTHFSVVDRHGNMVSMTQTLLSIFGAKVVSPSTGLLCNNGLMWFDPVAGRPNSLAPDKACLMNVCPVIGEAGRRRFAIGASGGRKIMPAVGQIAAALIDTEVGLAEAIAAPRIDVSGGEAITADTRLGPDDLAALRQVAPVIEAERRPFPYAFACPAGVMREASAQSGAAETHSPWGDAVAEPIPEEEAQ